MISQKWCDWGYAVTQGDVGLSHSLWGGGFRCSASVGVGQCLIPFLPPWHKTRDSSSVLNHSQLIKNLRPRQGLEQGAGAEEQTGVN